MAETRKRAAAGSERAADKKRHRHDAGSTTTAAGRCCCSVPTTTVRALLSRHAKHCGRALRLRCDRILGKHVRENTVLRCGRRWMFECGEGDQPRRHLLVSFDKEGSCHARWARPPGVPAICWVDVICEISQLSPWQANELPFACLGFLHGDDSLDGNDLRSTTPDPSPNGDDYRSTADTPTSHFKKRISQILLDVNRGLFVVCGLRWTGHALTAYVRHKERGRWESVSVIPGANESLSVMPLYTI